MTGANADGVRLRLRALGESILVSEGGRDSPPRALELSKGLALVTYLASLPGRSASRDHLVDMFWSDLEIEAGRHALRQHLWQLRRRFDDRLQIEGREVLALTAPLAFDRDELLAAAEAGDHQGVTERYTGDLLAGFASPGAVEFERWLDLERARLRSTFVRCGHARVHQLMAEGRSREASQLARRVRDVAPESQQAWRVLLDVLLSSGDALGAAIEAESLERRLRSEDLEPEPATNSVLALVRKGALPDSRGADAARGLSAALVGREREFAGLLAAWGEAISGRTSCAHITAPAGNGKSRLLHDLGVRLSASRARVVRVRANAGAAQIPGALASDLVAALAHLPGASGVSVEVARTLVRLNPSLSSVYRAAPESNAPDELRQRMIALRDLVQAVVEDRPLALLVDDMHWCDADSRHMIAGAIGGLDKERVLLVVAERSLSSSGVFLPHARHLALARLPLAAVVELLVSIATLPAASWAEAFPARLHRATGGSPLAVLQTLQLTREGGLLSIEEGGWVTRHPDALLTTIDAGTPLRQRVSALGDPERLVLAMLAVVGEPATVGTLERAFGVQGSQLHASLLALGQAGIVQQDDDSWRLAHDTFAEEALTQSPPAEVLRLHHLLGHDLAAGSTGGRALLSAGTHLRLAGDTVGDRALFVRYVRQRKSGRDRRSISTIAAEWLSTVPDDARVSELASSLPFGVRVGFSARAQAFLTVILLISVAVAALTIRTQGDEATREEMPYFVVAAFNERGLHPMARVSLDTDSGSGASFTLRAVTLRMADSAFREAQEILPPPVDSLPYIVVRAVGDSGVTDLFAVDKEGRSRRLTAARGDDVHPDWSPDGRSLAFVTSRWDSLEHPTLAVLELATGVVRRLSTSTVSELLPRWSPDGSRIAFLADDVAGTSMRVCTVRVDGSHRKCWNLSPRTDWHLEAWQGNDSLILRLADDSLPRMKVLALDSGAIHERTLACRPLNISRDASFLTCVTPGTALGPLGGAIASVHAHAVPQRLPAFGKETSDERHVFWSGRPGRGRHIETITFGNEGSIAIVGTPSRLTVVARRVDGSTIAARELTFTSSDTTIASIDTSGVLHARRPGRVDIVASVGGWRSTRRTFEVRPNSGVTILRERWERGWDTGWRVFGMPKSRVVTSGGVKALAIGGDGRFSSGVYARVPFERAEGLAVRVRLATKVRLQQWQEVVVALQDGVDTTSLAAWNHQRGFVWASGRIDGRAPHCWARYPGGRRGATYADSLLLDVGGASVFVAVDRSLRTGEWYDLVLQWLPDGRCAVAVNGRPLAVVPPVDQYAGPTHLFVHGNAFRTEMLVGELRVIRGLDRSVNWGDMLARQ
ncbi:MAG: AAA family ATPase [Gemmatimonadaceae bacterium]|nr:AAA family ATPase [Gemmatimonadaceae bacterium]